MVKRGVSMPDLKERFQLSDELLDNISYSDAHLRKTSMFIDNHETVGPELGLEGAEMTAINSERTVELQRSAMLKKWKQKFAWKATYRRLIDALLNCSRADLAEEVCRLLVQSLLTPEQTVVQLQERLKEKEKEVASLKEVIASAEKVYTEKLKKADENLKAAIQSNEELRATFEEAKVVQQKLQKKNFDLEGKVKKHELQKEAAGQAVSDATHLPVTEQEQLHFGTHHPLGTGAHGQVCKATLDELITPSRYEVSYTAVRRGQHKLHVRVNGHEINGSPFTMTVYPDPTQLGSPVRVVTGLNMPYGIAINSRGEMVVTEREGSRVSMFDVRGQRIQTFGSRGDRPEQMMYPAGIAVDDVDNIYVSSWHKLQKFTSSGELIMCVGQRGSKEGEFEDPRGVTIHSNQVYVCDTDNHRIQVFDLYLKFIRFIGSHGNGRGEFDQPRDVVFDTAGSMYVAEWGNRRVQVMDSSGLFIRVFGQEGEGNVGRPTAIHIADNYVYVSAFWQHRIAVYQTSGHFVTSFGTYGHVEGKLYHPYCITSCANGFIHVCDQDNNRVQTF